MLKNLSYFILTVTNNAKFVRKFSHFMKKANKANNALNHANVLVRCMYFEFKDYEFLL